MIPVISRRHLLSYRTLLFLFVVIILSGCSSTKTVPEGDALFAGYDIKVKNEEDSSNRELGTDLDGPVRPKPNASILGLKPKLWIYNAFYTEKEKGLKHWIQTKLGEPPVLLSEVDTSSINDIMRNQLLNKGYFNNSVESTTTIEKKKANIEWTTSVSEPYRIRKVEYTLNDSLPVHQAIRATSSESLLIPGEPYDLSTMTAERVRIDGELKEKGYYYFSPENLIFSVDTTAGNRQADVLLRVKRDAPSQALQPYTLDDIYIFANYFLGDSLSTSDTIDVRGYHYVPNEDYVKAKHLLRGVFLRQDSLYTRSDQLLTVNRLMGLPAYKFVNVQFEDDTASNNQLDAFIYLTPAMKKSLRAEARMVSKTNGFAGPGITASFRNRNTFRGSEQLNVELTGSFENQIGGNRTSGEDTNSETDTNNNGLTSYELGVQTTLTFPRIMSPFHLPNLRTEFVPKTRIGLGFNFLNRVQYFQMNSFNATYAYNWRPKKTLTFDVTPINLQYVQLANTTPEFDALLADRPYLQRSFENQFIIGSIYQATFSTQVYEDHTHQFYNSTTLDLSGNVVNALYSLFGSEAPQEDYPRTLLGQRYSQYTRIDNDFRYYLNIGEESQIATRFIAGVGFPYGNSSVMPYVKQFAIGGPNSIRAFRARSIGPGSYDFYANQTDNNLSYFDQTGDIKLEANIEYRFPIVGFFKGALFVDAGNVWLIKDTYTETGEVEKPGGKFEFNNFTKELAVGTGFGLRVDVEFFVLRFDFGIPVQVPYLPEGQRNVLNDFKFGFSGENSMTLNIAIGYPF
ncbi:BamA/TamA family outer membrane protein [Pontibacter silvestris]|uniref:BamA/TamA family outer membrane protein n=1 Tax=Pontibacter silvestris TaxID=2305183 RepID=A0ABW4X4D7_9BACT|nr:BamA/TamA family outer membrane protein [Pontibacter silvestris]MCC9135052.1 BamA/TamA family outer membrane protein [Pontibacter silvestris]